MRSLLPALLLALAPGVCDALTLAEAQALALTHNPDLAHARLELQALQGAELQAGARPNPELGVLLEDTRAATRTSTVQLSQAIELGGKRTARQAAAAQAREQAAVMLLAKQAEVRAAVAAAFFELLGAEAQARLATSSVELAGSATNAADKRLQAGKVPPLELAKARVAEAQARAELAQAQSEALQARARLAALWAQGPQAVTALEGGTGALPAPPTEAQLAAWTADAPALRLAQLDITRRQALTEGERAKRVPDLTFTVGAKRDAELGRTQAVIGFSLPLPVSDRNQGGLLEALRREDQAREALTAATLKLQADVAAATERLRASREQARLLADDALPVAQTAFDTALKGYELGKFAFLDVLDAQRSLFQLRRQQLQASADAHRAAAELDRLLGRNTQDQKD
ncbi:TolC family protein [Roseateles asaccharophilus]|uniref:Cobalt-zinc-cadmium efflux system outer membrane protein n=1 Tax=Roseateles asaccharophilus TaxID=582607 RepID=A0ABU2A759_9BURK|nr:TolC family protein [Roseateles asaccharophilus]MDR7331848.1 cobalt-zinc-cadmium efflux system outer membrane protein [Roseateles asaccharophilus]